MKAYLYCTKAKPYLIDDMDVFPEQCKEEHYTLEDDKHYDGIGLNGSVCFECEINKVEEIRYGLLTDCFTTNTLGECSLLNRAWITEEQTKDYYPRYALYLENVKKIKTIPIPSDVVNRPKKAPQNMCYMTMNGERCVLISIQPQHLANIANGLKDIEVRKSILNKLKELIK